MSGALPDVVPPDLVLPPELPDLPVFAVPDDDDEPPPPLYASPPCVFTAWAQDAKSSAAQRIKRYAISAAVCLDVRVRTIDFFSPHRPILLPLLFIIMPILRAVNERGK
jgi:hypothetical protein